MRADGLFIAIEVRDDAASDRQLAARLTEACPVDIYAEGPDGVQLVEKSLDECVLCGLCLAAAPEGAVKVIKLYDNEAALAAS